VIFTVSQILIVSAFTFQKWILTKLLNIPDTNFTDKKFMKNLKIVQYDAYRHHGIVQSKHA